VPAVILIGIGSLFLLNNLGIVYFHDIFRYWPVILIVVGIFRLIDSPNSGSRVAGGILIAVGGVALPITLGILDLSWNQIWPLFLIGLGVLMLTDRLTGGWGNWGDWGPKVKRALTGGSLHESSVFGGGKRVITDQNFTGGKIDAVFSGIEVDLRGASMVGDSAKLEINAVFGGVELKIPPTWNAVVKGQGVFGAYVDSSYHPKPSEIPNQKQLFLTGGAVFGGVEVKN
jgi:hypothetical protein